MKQNNIQIPLPSVLFIADTQAPPLSFAQPLFSHTQGCIFLNFLCRGGTEKHSKKLGSIKPTLPGRMNNLSAGGLSGAALSLSRESRSISGNLQVMLKKDSQPSKRDS